MYVCLMYIYTHTISVSTVLLMDVGFFASLGCLESRGYEHSYIHLIFLNILHLFLLELLDHRVGMFKNVFLDEGRSSYEKRKN